MPKDLSQEIKIGDKIRQLRKSLNLTQTELGKKISVGKTTIANYESNYSQPDYTTLSNLANFFNVSSDYLLGITTIENPKQFLEDSLSKINLTESEYDILLKDIIENNRIHLIQEEENEKINSGLSQIFKVYINYLENIPLDFEKDDDETINKMKESTEPIDKKFIDMLKTLDRNKIIFNENNNFSLLKEDVAKIPVIGKISAGLPIFASENFEGYEFAPASKLNSDFEYFYLIVRGDSMNQRFQDGDRVLVQKQPDLENGNIGVVLINGDDATVKRFKKENGLIILEPMSNNPIHQVQIYDPNKINVKIIGKVISYTGNIN